MNLHPKNETLMAIIFDGKDWPKSSSFSTSALWAPCACSDHLGNHGRLSACASDNEFGNGIASEREEAKSCLRRMYLDPKGRRRWRFDNLDSSADRCPRKILPRYHVRMRIRYRVHEEAPPSI